MIEIETNRLAFDHLNSSYVCCSYGWFTGVHRELRECWLEFARSSATRIAESSFGYILSIKS